MHVSFKRPKMKLKIDYIILHVRCAHVKWLSRRSAWAEYPISALKAAQDRVI